jgi:hypothetical protein
MSRIPAATTMSSLRRIIPAYWSGDWRKSTASGRLFR